MRELKWRRIHATNFNNSFLFPPEVSYLHITTNKRPVLCVGNFHMLKSGVSRESSKDQKKLNFAFRTPFRTPPKIQRTRIFTDINFLQAIIHMTKYGLWLLALDTTTESIFGRESSLKVKFSSVK